MLHLLDPRRPDQPFPDPTGAEREPDGLLAIGGDLSLTRLVNAYRRGIFPWYSQGQPILWWSPDPRTVLYPDRLKVSRSLRKTIRRGLFEVSRDTAFDDVVAACAAPRRDTQGTWITDEMALAYRSLFRSGLAHSVEVWQGGRLVGGLYGVALGRVFFGESMFNRVSDASKIALVHLVEQLQARSYRVIDCQVYSAHLISLGAQEIPRAKFLQELEEEADEPDSAGPWRSEPSAAATEDTPT
jgi:leucyl/phenylalanyl-tRNA--protein transferase